jgi:hypothetical protein
MPQFDLKDCTITLKDGNGTPKSLELTIGQGNIQWTEAQNLEFIADRGKIDTASGGVLRTGDQIPLEVSIDIVYDFYTVKAADADWTPEEFIKGQNNGAAAALTTTGADDCEPYACDIEIARALTHCTTDDEDFTFSEFRWEQMNFDLKAGTLSVSGKCKNIAPTVART